MAARHVERRLSRSDLVGLDEGVDGSGSQLLESGGVTVPTLPLVRGSVAAAAAVSPTFRFGCSLHTRMKVNLTTSPLMGRKLRLKEREITKSGRKACAC